MGNYFISTGNLTDGFEFIGPFKLFEDALAHVEDHTLKDWHINEMAPPQAKHHHHDKAA